MTPRVQKITAALLVVFASQASAALLSADHPDFGAGSLTLNTTQGLYWLAPSVTVGLSFVETQALLSGDARFAGFRVASLVELRAFTPLLASLTSTLQAMEHYTARKLTSRACSPCKA
jgi:hypothetical protein